MSQNDPKKQIDEAVGHIVRRDYPGYLGMALGKAVDHLVDLVMTQNQPSFARQYGFYQMMAVIDNPDATENGRAELVKRLGRNIALLPDGEKDMILQKIAQHVATSDSNRVRNASIATLGDALNSTQVQLSGNDFNTYTDLLIGQMDAEKWQTKAAAFKATSAIVVNPKKDLSDGKRVAIATNLLSLLKTRVRFGNPEVISEPTRSMVVAVSALKDNAQLLCSGLNNVYAAIKNEPDQESAKKSFRTNIQLSQDRWPALKQMTFDKQKETYILKN